MEREKFVKVLEAQLVPALGCTDPVGLAYGAACARSFVAGDILNIRAQISVNLIKNAAAVCIPKTGGRCGISLALALGAVGGDWTKGFEVLSGITGDHLARAEAMVKDNVVSAVLADTDKSLYLCVEIETTEGKARIIVEDGYLNVTSIVVNGEIVKAAGCGCGEEPAEEQADCEEEAMDVSFLSIASILQFVKEATTEDLARAAQAIEMNVAVSEAGLAGNYGIGTGICMNRMMCDGSLSGDWIDNALTRTLAAVDARMAGADIAVMSNTGSGNQGLTCTLPVISVADFWGKSEDERLRAVALSCLVAVHIKENFGLLGAVCGAVIAGAATSCAVVYLQGGGEEQMVQSMKTVLGGVAGLMCDGAKAGCAVKVMSCVHCGLMAAAMAMEGRGIQGTDGIVGETEQEMIDNFVRVSREGLEKMDRVILDIILKK